MIQLIIKNLSGKTIYCNTKTEKMLDVLQENYIDWMHACGKKGRCITCKANILKGIENLAPHTEVELKYMKSKKLLENERLTCQAVLKGDVTIEVPELYKLPHVKYSE